MNRKTLLKNLVSGFLPLLIFIAADEFFGLVISLSIALTVSCVQLGITYYREKKLDKFALLDAGMILVLGVVSAFFNNPIFILLKPAVIEFVFLIMID
ncbi:septation protein IspZ, partial [bacterium]|nr:septation protein IspZ [bacterium]